MEGQSDSYRSLAKREHKKLKEELKDWKSQQESLFAPQERQIQNLETPVPVPVPAFIPEPGDEKWMGSLTPRYEVSPEAQALASSMRRQLNEQKEQLETQYAKKAAENKSWHKSTLDTIQKAFDTALEGMEARYQTAKAMAL